MDIEDEPDLLEEMKAGLIKDNIEKTDKKIHHISLDHEEKQAKLQDKITGRDKQIESLQNEDEQRWNRLE